MMILFVLISRVLRTSPPIHQLYWNPTIIQKKRRELQDTHYTSKKQQAYIKNFRCLPDLSSSSESLSYNHSRLDTL